jgi:hypothetical protein
MRKNQNTFAKRQREMDKKRKAKNKRDRRQDKKDEPSKAVEPTTITPQADAE